ncbi:hypothetical protein D3C77_444780 [compost metagenome]
MQPLRRQRVNGVGRHLNFQVRADLLQLRVEVLDQQHEAEIGVLQLVLVARVAAHPARMPDFPGELDHRARLLEQRHDLGADQPAIQLADRIDAATQQTNLRQIGHRRRARIDKQPAVLRRNPALTIQPRLIFNAHS